MQQSKLIKSLQYLTSAELKRLLQFLKSPFFNANKSIVRMYLLLRPEYPEFSSPKLNKEKIFKKIFPNRAYDHKKLQNLMVDFHALLEKYLVLLQLEKEKIEQKKFLALAYAERPNCYKLFVKQTKVIHKELDALPYRDEIYFQEKKKLYLLHYGHPGTAIQKEGKESLELAMRNFDHYKNIAEMKLKCAQNARVNSLRESYSDKILNAENVVLEIYKELDQLQHSQEDDEKLQNLSNLFITNIYQFRQEDQSNVLKILSNYCIRLTNRGNVNLVPVSLNLYKTGLEHNCLFTQSKMTEHTFSNIVTTGIHCEEFEWTKSFMEEYQDHLPFGIKDDALALGFGQWHYKKGDLEQASKHLLHSFKEIRFRIKGKALLIRIWYDLLQKDESYFDLLISQLDAFEKFIRRDKTISEGLSKGYLKFTYFMRKLVMNNGGKSAKQQLLKDISTEQNLTLKNWLMEKLM